MSENRKVTDNVDFVKRLQEIPNKKTLYVLSAFGAPAGDKSNRTRYAEGTQAYNKQAKRKKKIMESSDDTFFFDCVGLVKGVLWGWNGQTNKKNGGALYKCNDVPDKNALGMLKVCKDISTDFSKIMPGEYLHMEGHCGVYLGDGLAIECTPKWKDGVQITACNCKKDGYNTRTWTKHGKLPYFPYIEDEPHPEEEEEVEVIVEETVEVEVEVVKHNAPKQEPVKVENPQVGDTVFYNNDCYYRGIYPLAQKKPCVPQNVKIDGIYNSIFPYNYRVILEDGTRAFVPKGHFEK